MNVFLLLSFFVVTVKGTIYKSNNTDFSKCKVYYSRSEGTYREFFTISEQNRRNDTILDFHFSVLASSDAHILLAHSAELERNDPAYEIVLGAGGNTFCDIRRAQKSEVKASMRIKGLLNALDIQSFWLHVSKDGLIEVGREGEELAFISWQDPDPLPLKVFSFCTWQGVEAKWFYDCPREDFHGNSAKIVKKLTPLEKLRRDLLSFYDPYVRPVFHPFDTIVVTIVLVLHYISLNEHKPTLEFKGATRLTWQDEKLLWNPDDYAGIRNLHIFRREIWQPDLILYNDANYGQKNILRDSMMRVTSNGLVEWSPLIQGKVWCDVHDFGHWPADSHFCNVIFGFGLDNSNLQLELNPEGNMIIGNNWGTEWKVLQVKTESNLGWTNSTYLDDDRNDTPFLKLNFKLKRSSSLYTALFFTPYTTASILLSFCLSNSYLRICLGCFQLILSSGTLAALASFIPIHPTKIPYLILLYSYSTIAAIIAIMITILNINLSNPKFSSSAPRFLQKILVFRPVQLVLGLPVLKISDDYGKLDEISLTGSCTHNTFWVALSKAIDKISLIVYFILIIYSLCLKY